MKKTLFHIVFLTMTCLVPVLVYGQSEEHIDELLSQARHDRFNDKYLESLSKLDSALGLSYELADQQLIAACLSELGVGAMYLGRHGEALNAFQKGLTIREGLSDSSGMQESFNYIATVHHAQSNYALAKLYYEESMAIAEQMDSLRMLAVLRNNLGVLSEDQGDYTSAINYLNGSMNMWEAMSDTAWISVSLRHLGKCYQKQGQFEKSEEVYEKAYRLSQQSGSNRNVVRAAVALGELKLQTENPNGSVSWCEAAHKLALKHDILVGIQESADCLTKAHEMLGNHAPALAFYKLSRLLKDSVYGNNRMKELTQLELNYQFEKEQLKDSLEYVRTTLIQDKKISNQRIGLFAVGIITVIMLLLALVVYQGKKKSDSLLLNILPKKVAEELKQTGASKATNFDNVTVIFTDFKGFTEMSEKLSAEELVAEINHCFSVFDSIMTKYGIEKIKTIGDAYMAASGLPVASEDHAVKATKAALEMIEFVKARKQFLDTQNRLGFEMRVGLNTGNVIAGIVGTTKFQYDIWGDTVNTAARMESNGEVGKVNVSGSTYEQIKNQFDYESRGKIQAKGKGEMEMYFVSNKA